MSQSQLPESIKMLIKQGYEHLQEGASAEAQETFSAALAIEPKSPEGLRGLGIAFFQLKQWPSAADAFHKARDLAPEETDNWVDLGISLAMDSQTYPALEVFETLLAKYPVCIRGHIELGLLYLRLGAIPRGRQQLEKVLAHRPTLAQRQFVQSILHEQVKQDKKRAYRPDFEALRRQSRQPSKDKARPS